MAENVGSIEYTVTLDTAKMIDGQREADKVLQRTSDSMAVEGRAAGKLNASLTEVAKATKIHVAATQIAAVAAREAAKAAEEAAASGSKLGDAVKKSGGEMGKQAISAKQLAAATRGLPAQFTDIATGIAAGQNPLTVLLQQGGQLKDMFGGVGAAARALGSYVASLVSPLTVLAAAAGVAVYGFLRGSEEMQDFKRTLILTGGASGVTADQLNTLSDQLDRVSGVTRGQAAEALVVFAQLGISGADSIGKLTEAALRMESAGGPSVAETAKAFKDLEKSPLQASLKLNDSVNFLTTSLYLQIKTLEQHGKVTEAAKVAQDAYADAIMSRTQSVTSSLGLVEKSWKAIKDVARDGWDAILGIGRSQTPEQALEGTRQRIADLQRQLAGGGFSSTGGGAATGRGLGQRERANKEALLAALQEQVRAYDRAQLSAQAVAKAESDQLDIVKARAEFDKSGEKFLDDRKRMELEIAQAREIGARAGMNEMEIQKRISDIRNSYAGRLLAAQSYYEALVTGNASAIAKIDAEEKQALTENQRRAAQDVANAGIYAAAKVEIQKKAARERGLLEEKTTQQIADLNIALTTDQETKIEAIRIESFRRADAAAKLGSITYAQAERDKTLAAFTATQQRAALEEKTTQTLAEVRIAATIDELTRIDLQRREAFRRADVSAKAGAITYAQAEADKAKAAIDAQNQIRQAVLSVNPLAQLQKEYEDKLAIVTFYEQQIAQAGIDGTAFAEQKKAELSNQYRNQRLQLAESEFALQSDTNKFLIDSLNAMASTATSSITGLITGTMTAQDAMRGLANVVLNEAVSALVQIGLQQIKNALVGDTVAAAEKARAAANGAFYAASVSAQVAGTTALAAQNAFAATAAIPIVGPALAPAAAAAAGATAAGLGATAIATAPIAGARRYGGPVDAGSLYRVNESGAPEMYVGAGGQQYMMPTRDGNVVPADGLGASKAPTIIIQNLGTPQRVESQTYDAGSNTATLVVADIVDQITSNSGPVWSALTSSSNVQGRL